MALPPRLEAVAGALSYALGGLVLALAALTLATSMSVAEVAGWGAKVLGPGFLVALAALVLLAVFGWYRFAGAATEAEGEAWMVAGLQAASGIATLALTFTLLGISLGIGSLAGRELTPTTVRPIIRELTEHFSLAFMTTVVGLPLSAVLRSGLLLVRARRRAGRDHQPLGDAP